jgi:hypothetical protein
MPHVRENAVKLSDLCVTPEMTREERRVCIEGVVERMAKYQKPTAQAVCRTLSGEERAACDQAVQNGMYNMNKDLRLYVQ